MRAKPDLPSGAICGPAMIACGPTPSMMVCSRPVSDPGTPASTTADRTAADECAPHQQHFWPAWVPGQPGHGGRRSRRSEPAPSRCRHQEHAACHRGTRLSAGRSAPGRQLVSRQATPAPRGRAPTRSRGHSARPTGRTDSLRLQAPVPTPYPTPRSRRHRGAQRRQRTTVRRSSLTVGSESAPVTAARRPTRRT